MGKLQYGQRKASAGARARTRRGQGSMAKDETAGAAPETVRKARRPAARSDVASFIVMDVMRAAAELEAQGRSIIHMEVGQPGTPAPEAARAKALAALGTETLG